VIRRPGLRQSAAYAAVGVASVLIVIKVAAWLITNSVAMLSSLIDSVLDVSASVLNLLAVYHAARPADAEHRFGHGKLEPLAGIGQTLFIGASGMFLLFEAVPRLLEPQPVVEAEVGIIVMLVSIALTGGLVLYQRSVVRRTGSVAISADSLHYTGDLAMNGSIIVSLVLSSLFGWYILDPIFAIGIAVYVLYNAMRIARSSVDILMDRELPDEERALIERISRRHPDVYGVHELRTRSSGLKRFIQLHLEMHENLTLRRAHESAEQVEAWIQEAFPDAEIIIHQDPVGERRGD
jgi:ferrous-iron efflux pump FieF